jgi:hypothetical protein
MHYHVEINALICRIKRLDETYLGGFSLQQLVPETLPLCYWNLRFWTSTFLYQQFIFYKYLFRPCCHITSSANKSISQLHIIVSYSGLQFRFLNVSTHSSLPSPSTRSTFYVPNPPSTLGYNIGKTGVGVKRNRGENGDVGLNVVLLPWKKASPVS